jgi:hypothetical protein
MPQEGGGAWVSSCKSLPVGTQDDKSGGWVEHQQSFLQHQALCPWLFALTVNGCRQVGEGGHESAQSRGLSQQEFDWAFAKSMWLDQYWSHSPTQSYKVL